MRPGDRVLYACARQTMLPVHQQSVLATCRHETIAWDLLYSTAELHHVAPLIFVNLQRDAAIAESIPPHTLGQFKASLYQNCIMKEMMAEMTMEALSFFNRKSIDVMLIKGAALDILVYQQPWFTISIDIDLVLRPHKVAVPYKDREEIAAYLQELSIKWSHSEYLKLMECYYFEHTDVTFDGTLLVNFAEIWSDAVHINYRGQDVFVMSPEDMLISACINCCRKGYFRLKAFCDIAEIIHFYPGMNWNKLITKVETYQCAMIVYTALLMTKMTLGCSVPEEVFDRLPVRRTRSALIRMFTHALTQHTALSFLSMDIAKGGKITRLLLLQYLSYQWSQVWRRVWINALQHLPSHRRSLLTSQTAHLASID